MTKKRAKKVKVPIKDKNGNIIDWEYISIRKAQQTKRVFTLKKTKK